MTAVTFENATFSELIKRIERVTPKKGEAFDKAGGVVLDVAPGEDWAVVARATNLEIYYMEWVNSLRCEGEPASWRLPNLMLANIASKLPIGTGKTVTLESSGGRMSISSGRFRSKIPLLVNEYYPQWEPFDPAATTPVADLGARVQQVAWATARAGGGDVLSGVRFDGQTLAATDRYRLASVPLPVEGLARNLVVPLGPIAPLLKQMGDTNIGVLDSGMLALMPNEYTQIRSVIYDSKYPPIEKIMNRDQTESVKVHRDVITEMVNRVTAADATNRMPEMQIFIGGGEVAFYVKEADGDSFAGDVYEAPGQAAHERFMFRMSPSFLLDALAASPSASVDIHYTVGKPMGLIRIDGGSGYECWITPRTGFEQKEEG